MSSSTPTRVATSPAPEIRIVGIGASAGGLHALEQFLEHVPPKSGMAYVVIQHLDPTQKAMLSELLQRVTRMPVREARQGMVVEPDCVYVIPPNTELRVADDTLQLSAPAEPRGLRLPINVLFSSLASARGERAVAVVLSGMGADGTLGMQAVKAVGGLTAAQAPETAQFDSMPRSAIAAGCADIIASPADLPAKILACVVPPVDCSVSPDTHDDVDTQTRPMDRIFHLLQTHTRHDFSLYKVSTLHRRIERRMMIHQLASRDEYASFLARNPQEIDLLLKELLIGVTEFFRDRAPWQHLEEVALPELLASRTTQRELRAWVVGCSTGEEAYSLAMVFTEAVEKLPGRPQFSLQIFASDLNPDAIASARRGRYPLTIKDGVSADRLSRFFSAHESYYQVSEKIRDMVLFAQHDVILDPPFTRLDALSCRNLLIYFDAALQKRLMPLFHYSLRPEGILMLGTSETVGRFSHLFSPIHAKYRLYRRQDAVSIGGPDFLLRSFPPLSGKSKELHVTPSQQSGHDTANLQAAANEVLLQVHSPPAVVINADGDIVYISGRTGKYLEPAAGKANWNFHAMAREGLRAPLATAIRRAAVQVDPVQLRGVRIHSPEGANIVDVTVQALHKPAALKGMTMVVFHDVARPTSQARGETSGTSAPSDYEAKLQDYQDEIVSLRESARASSEELQSTNEELQSTNEELQSTNEELTTSKEEMQSMNEELQTINNELEAKLDDLALAQSDMKNVLNSVDIAILFLDQHLQVRRYTDRAAKIINLRESDVGRPLSDLTTSLQYPGLHADATDTLRTLVPTEKQILADDERWFSVRIMPYRRLDNLIDGVVITLVDITQTKQLESRLRKDADD
ncbi:MAG: PAS domain-containing protein [Gammaproteobacteria bacterium]|nr:PAS domain-containing protein [Gammaproteobacteria bacterium]